MKWNPKSSLQPYSTMTNNTSVLCSKEAKIRFKFLIIFCQQSSHCFTWNMCSCEILPGGVAWCSQVHRLILVSGLKSAAYGVFLFTSKVLDARRRGATTEAYGVIRRKEERSKGTPQMMPCWWIRDVYLPFLYKIKLCIIGFRHKSRERLLLKEAYWKIKRPK